MDIISAAHKTVHDPKTGGSSALAVRLGMSNGVLNSKVSPTCNTHHLRLDEAMAIMEFTGNYTIIDAMASRLGGAFCKVEAGKSPKDMLMHVLQIGGHGGNLMNCFNDAMGDGIVHAHEAKDLIGIIQRMKSDLQAMELELAPLAKGHREAEEE